MKSNNSTHSIFGVHGPVEHAEESVQQLLAVKRRLFWYQAFESPFDYSNYPLHFFLNQFSLTFGAAVYLGAPQRKI